MRLSLLPSACGRDSDALDFGQGMPEACVPHAAPAADENYGLIIPCVKKPCKCESHFLRFHENRGFALCIFTKTFSDVCERLTIISLIERKKNARLPQEGSGGTK